ncbi:hypothetical protein [Streptomyces sp. NPDC056244]|uniref:hypothetical protein n=1 Tax=Streptomyces sp. NPDC056244 TaxID=3345762 RepID=UPI0035E27902
MKNRSVRRIVITTLTTVLITAGLLASKPHTGSGPERGGTTNGRTGMDERPGDGAPDERPEGGMPDERPEGGMPDGQRPEGFDVRPLGAVHERTA